MRAATDKEIREGKTFSAQTTYSLMGAIRQAEREEVEREVEKLHNHHYLLPARRKMYDR